MKTYIAEVEEINMFDQPERKTIRIEAENQYEAKVSLKEQGYRVLDIGRAKFQSAIIVRPVKNN